MDNRSTFNVSNGIPSMWNPAITQEQWQERVITVIIYGLASSWAACGNVLTIILTIIDSDLRKIKTNHIIAHVSVGDFMCGTVFVFGQLKYILFLEYLPSAGCSILALFNVIAAACDWVFPPLLAVNRYISIYHGERYERIYTTRNTNLMVLFCWSICFAIIGSFAALGLTGWDEDNLHCCILLGDKTWAIIFYWFTCIILVTVNDSIVVFCNIKIYKRLFKHKGTETLATNVVKQNKEIFYFLVADTALPIASEGFYFFIKFFYKHRTNIHLKRYPIAFFLVGCGLRGFFPLIFLRPYRRAFNKIAKCDFLKRDNSISPAQPNNNEPSKNITIGSAQGIKLNL